MSIIKVGDIFEIKGYFLEVVEYNRHDNIIVKCLGVSEDTFKVRANALRIKQVRNPFARNCFGVGYLGMGEFKTGGAKKGTLEYKAWMGMLQRVYGDVLVCYLGCTVHQHWHNFQNFAKWYTSQRFYGRGYHMDKDLLSRGVKIYSPETCCLLPVEINSLIVQLNEKINGLPVGVHHHRNGRFKSTIRMNRKHTFLSVYETIEDAKKAFYSAKVCYTKVLIKDWEDFIDEGLGNLILRKVIENIS